MESEKGQIELLCRTDADSETLKNLWCPEETVCGVGDVLGLWDGNPVKSDCYDHYTTTDVISSLESLKKKTKTFTSPEDIKIKQKTKSKVTTTC